MFPGDGHARRHTSVLPMRSVFAAFLLAAGAAAAQEPYDDVCEGPSQIPGLTFGEYCVSKHFRIEQQAGQLPPDAGSLTLSIDGPNPTIIGQRRQFSPFGAPDPPCRSDARNAAAP